MADQTFAGDGRLKIGSLLARSYQILLGNLSAFLVIALAAGSPHVIFYSWMNYGPRLFADAGDRALMATAGDALIAILEIVLSFVATGVIVYGTLRELQGQSGGFRETIGRGLKSLLPVILVSLAATLAVLLGLVLLVLPGIFFLVVFWVAVPVTVIERRGVRASLERSRELTRGYRWPILALLLLDLAMSIGFAFVPELFLDYKGAFLRSVIIEWAGQSLIVAFWSVVSAVTYVELKRIKEGAEVAEIARVFD